MVGRERKVKLNLEETVVQAEFNKKAIRSGEMSFNLYRSHVCHTLLNTCSMSRKATVQNYFLSKLLIIILAILCV